MTDSFLFRIIALAVLIVISSLVHAPEHYSAVDYGTMAAGEEGSCRTTGIHSTGQVASPATAGNAAPQCAFPEEGVVLTAFDTQEEHSSRAIEIHNDDQMLSVASTAANAAMQHTFLNNSSVMAHRDTQVRDHIRTHGIDNAGQMASSTSSTGNPQQHASFHDSGGGMAYLDNQGNNFSPATGLPNPIAVVASANTGEEDGLAPFIYGSGKPDMSDLIDPPDWRIEPTAGGNNAGNFPAAECHSDSSCDALLPTANNSVPEPGSLTLLGLGIIGMVLSRRRKAAIARQ